MSVAPPGSSGSRGAERRIALVGEADRPELQRCAAVLARDGFVIDVVAGSRRAALSAAYKRAALAVVADPAAMPGAAFAQRAARVPWLALVVPPWLDSRLPPRRLVEQARAVLAPAHAAARVRSAYPNARFVPLEDEERLASVARDVAIAADARGHGSGVRPALAAAWMFADDHAGRLAIRLMAATGKATRPIHPKHLTEPGARRWYLQEVRAGDRLLDVGCGHGAHTLAAARVVREAVGVDVDEAALDDARRRAEREGIENVVFERADLADPAALARFDAGSFDAVLLLDVLEHLVDREHLLRELTRVLTEDGRLLVAVPNRETPYKRWRRDVGAFAYGDPDHKVEYDAEGARRELERAGFSVVRLEPAGIDSPFAGFGALLATVSLGAYGRLAERRHRLGRERPDDAVAFHLVATPTPARRPRATAGRASPDAAPTASTPGTRRGARAAIALLGAALGVALGVVAAHGPVLMFPIGVTLAAATLALAAPARVWSAEFFARWGFIAGACFVASVAGFALGAGERSAVLALCAAAAWALAATTSGPLRGGLVVITGALPAFGLGALASLAPQIGLLTLLLVALLAAILALAPRSLLAALRNPGIWLCGLFAAAILVSALDALDRQTSLSIAKTELGRAFLLPLAVVAAFGTLGRRDAFELARRLRAVVVAVAAAGAVLSLLQIGLELGYPVRFAAGTSMEQFVGTRALGFAEHPNSWAAFLLIAIALAGVRWLRSGAVLWGATTLLLVVSLIVTGSRSGWLALGAASLAAFVATRSVKLRLAAVGVVLASVAVAFQFANFRSFVVPNETENDRGRIAMDESARFRLKLTLGELELARREPVTGVGPGNVALGLDGLGDDYLERNNLVFPSGRVDKHNVYTGLVAESGLPALAAFLAALAAGFVFLFRARRAAGTLEERTVVEGLLGALLATVVIAAFTDADRHLYLWWILGVAFALRAPVRGKPEPADAFPA